MKFYKKYISKMRHKIISFEEAIYNKNSLKKLRSNLKLWGILKEYIELTKSTGCSYSDYWVLYNYIRQHKPREILECGTGVTTIVMAFALIENEKEGNGKGRITSMEDKKEWYDYAVRFLPEHLKSYVDLRLSEKMEYCYSIFRGVGYRDLPDRKYEFVFIDGPGTLAPSDGTRSFDFDYINVVMKSDNPVYAIVDKRMGTCYVLQKIFGVDKVRYNPTNGLCFVGPFNKNDIRSKISSESFSHSIRVFGKNELNLHMDI